MSRKIHRHLANKQQPNLFVVDEPTSLDSRHKVKFSDLKSIIPLTKNQKTFFDLYEDGVEAFILHGVAGTGKTYIALYNALRDVLSNESPYKKVVIVRSAVPSREIGHLPGNEKEKSEVYMQPYKEILAELFPKYGEKAYTKLKEQGYADFMITSFVRGLTLENAIIIVDEFQSMNFHELNSIVTRVGKNSKIIFCGDFRQTDLQKKHDVSGLPKFMTITSHMDCFETVDFEISDIVRSAFVKSFLIATMECEDLDLI